MHKCIEARDIYIYSPTDRLRSNGTSSFRTFSIRTTPIATFYYPSHSPARNRTFKAALYTGCAVKKRRNAQTFGIESRRPRLREKKFVFVSWRTERTNGRVRGNERNFLLPSGKGVATRGSENGSANRTYDIERGPAF